MRTLHSKLHVAYHEPVSTPFQSLTKLGRDVCNIQYPSRSGSRVCSSEGFQHVDGSSKDRVRTGTEPVRLWYNSISQWVVWTNRASEIRPCVGDDGGGGDDLETIARRRSLARGHDSLRLCNWLFRLDREPFLPFGLVQSQLMARPGPS